MENSLYLLNADFAVISECGFVGEAHIFVMIVIRNS
jgi:hypothetical protein